MPVTDQIDLAKKFLRDRLLTDNTTLFGYNSESHQIKELISRTVNHGESNSAVIIGPKGCGKTTVSTSVIHENSSRIATLTILASVSVGFIGAFRTSAHRQFLHKRYDCPPQWLHSNGRWHRAEINHQTIELGDGGQWQGVYSVRRQSGVPTRLLEIG